MSKIQNNNTKEQYLRIRELFFKGKYAQYVKVSTKFLEKRPNDIEVRFMRAKSYRFLGKFDEAFTDLKYNLEVLEGLKSDKTKYLEKVRHTIVEYFSICYYLNKYEEAMKFLPILYENRFLKPISLYLMETIMRKQLGLPLLNQKLEKDEYIRNQVNKYDEIMALKHALEHLSPDIDIDYKSKFADNVDISYLFEVIKDNINHKTKVNCNEVSEIHFYVISNIGVYKNTTCNYIKVAVIPNTTNIISVYPVIDTEGHPFENLQHDRRKLFIQTEEKVKRISQKDRFNNRFKRV